MTNLRCVHYHLAGAGGDHPSCLPVGHLEGIALLDIETTSLVADYGIVLSWAFKELGGRVISDVIAPGELRSRTLDRRIVKSLVTRLSDYDTIVTFNGQAFDLPFVRTRAFRHGFDRLLPRQRTIKHIDVYLVSRGLLRMSHRRQENIERLLTHRSTKVRLTPEAWEGLLSGKSTAYWGLLRRNISDVRTLEAIYKRLSPFMNPLSRRYV